MTDEKFVLISEIKEKKNAARGSRNKVTRKGRRVKLPSDYMTEKEKKAMNGEVKSFDLKQPMKWAEFCAMPDDLQKEYISRLQKLYRATDVAIGEMMGVSKASIYKKRMKFGLEGGEKGRSPLPEWNSFVKYGTPARGSTPIRELVPAEIREKLSDLEDKPPIEDKPEKAPVPTVVDKNLRMDIDDYRSLNEAVGILKVLAATTENPKLLDVLNKAVLDIMSMFAVYEVIT